MAKRVGGLEELTTLPRPPSRLKRGHPSPDPTPLSAFGARYSAFRLLLIYEMTTAVKPRWLAFTDCCKHRPGSQCQVDEEFLCLQRSKQKQTDRSMNIRLIGQWTVIIKQPSIADWYDFKYLNFWLWHAYLYNL